MSFDLAGLQENILESDSPRRIVVGGRQTGKSTVCCIEAIWRADDGQHSIIISPTEDHRRELQMQALEILPTVSTARISEKGRTEFSFDVGGSIEFRTPSVFSKIGEIEPDCLIVDDAAWIDDDRLRDLVTEADAVDADILLCSTPCPNDVQFCRFSRSTAWDTARFSMVDMPYLDERAIQNFAESLTTDQKAREVYGLFV